MFFHLSFYPQANAPSFPASHASFLGVFYFTPFFAQDLTFPFIHRNVSFIHLFFSKLAVILHESQCFIYF